MIYEKQFPTPKFYRRTVRRKLSLFRDKSASLACFGLHFREDEGRLVPAEGAELVSALPAGTIELLTSRGHSEQAYYRTTERYTSIGVGGDYQGGHYEGQLVIYQRDDSWDKRVFLIAEEGIYELLQFAVKPLPNTPGGSCGCIACERLMTASGNTVYWSAPLYPNNWTESIEEAGRVELASREGDILAMFPFLERVVLFREHGINELRVRGDTLDFRMESVPVPCSRLIKGSVRQCGSKIVFLAEDGVYAYDGKGASRLTGCGFSEIDLEKDILTASCGRKYYAAVTLKCGEKCLWIVDPEAESGHFLRVQADMLAGGDAVYYAEGGNLFRLTEQGMPVGGRQECTLTTEPSMLGLSPRKKYLDGITIEGKGRFFVEARAERGRCRTVVGNAGERLALPAPVAGTSFSLNLRTNCEHAEIKSVIFDLREETGTWK